MRRASSASGRVASGASPEPRKPGSRANQAAAATTRTIGRRNHPSVLASALNFIVLSQVSCRAEAGPAAPAIAACIEGLRAGLRIEGHDVEPPLRLLALAGRKMQHGVDTTAIADRPPTKDTKRRRGGKGR